MSNKTPIRVTGTFTPSGTQDVNIVSPIPVPVDLTIDVATTSTVTRVSSSITNVVLIAANANRKGLMLYNDSTADQYIKFGSTATSTDFTVILTRKAFYEMSFPLYVGQIDVISSSATGAIQVTELS